MREIENGASHSESNKQTRVTALLLGLMAIAIYAPMIGWGVPYATAPDRVKTFAVDEILPLEALAEMHNTFVVSKPDRNYGYPWWHYFVVAVVQTPYIAYLLASGELQSPTPEFPFGLRDPVETLQTLTIIGRSVTVLMAAGVVVAAYCFSRILWGHLTGVVAALLTMLNYLMFYYSRTGNLDVPAFFWISLALVVFAKILRETLTSRRAACLGVLAGLAMATKDQAVTIFLPLGLFLLSRRFSWSSETGYRVRPLLIGLGAFVLAYVVGTGMLIDPQRHINHVYYLFFNQERLTWASFYHPPHPKTLEGLVNLVVDSGRSFFAAMSPPTLLASVAGVLLTLRFSPRLLVLLLPIVVQLLILNLPTGYAILRYLLPFTFVIDAFAASAVVMLRGSSLRALWIPALVILCGWRLLIGADLTYAQYHDTRYAASDWLRANAKPGDRVEFFGIGDAMPYLPAEILSRRVGGRTQWKRESGHGSYVLDYLADKGPEYVVIVPDATSRPGMEYSGDCPPEVYAALMSETAQYKLAAYFPTRSFLPRAFQRPSLDNPSVCPPVRIFAK